MLVLGVLLFFVLVGVFFFSILEISGRESDMEEERERNETSAVSNLGHRK